MALIEVTTAKLSALDGGTLAACLDLELKKAVMDCRDRPAEKVAREITLTIKLKPCPPDPSGDVDTVYLDYTVKGKHPPRKSKVINCGVQRNNKLHFAELAPDNHNQRTIDELTGDDE